MKAEISIVIIVKNDRGIADTLAGLELQKKPAPTEIIVVDASEPSLLADIRAKYPDVHWYQFVSKISGKTTIPEQRNFGIQQANGGIIVFIDANCIPSENWLVKLTAPLLDGSESITAGSVYSADPKSLNFYTNATKGNYIGLTGSANLAFKKEVWKKVGGFDESFLFSSDNDFLWRCVDLGYMIRNIHGASITHDWGSFRDEVKRSINYGIGRSRLFKKHPRRLKELSGDAFYILAYTLYIIGLPLTFLIWWYPFLIVFAFVKNINDKPFKTVIINLIYTIAMWVGFFQILFNIQSII